MEPTVFTRQMVYCGDCVDILKHFPSESVDLVYIDPPFNSSRNYEVFWGDVAEKMVARASLPAIQRMAGTEARPTRRR